MRVLAIEGHAGVLDPFEHWKAGRDVPSTTGVAFSHQLFDALRSVGATATVLAQRPDRGRDSAHGITVEHTGRVLFGRTGLDYHLESARLASELIARARREQIDVVMTVGYPPAAFLLPLLYAGHHVVVVHHCVLWPVLGGPTRTLRALAPLERRAYQHPRCHLLAVSDDIVAQLETLRAGKGPPIVRFLPLFRREFFERIAPPDPTAPTLRVGFVGRIERNKGVFDALEAVRRLRAAGQPIRLELCGDGSARAELAAEIERLALGEAVTYHGWCDHERLRRVLSDLHVVVAPTRSDFVEGFNMVVAEALLAKRAVVTSRISPALEYVRGPSTIEVAVDSVDDLTEGLRRCVVDRTALAHASAAGAARAAFLFEERYSYRAAVSEVLRAIAEGREARPVAPSAAALRARADRSSVPGGAAALGTVAE